MTERPPGDPEAGFEAFLRSAPPEMPDPVRRELVRRRFLEHASRGGGPLRMSGTMDSSRDRRPTDADLERWLRERAPLEAPRAELRERSRRRFLAALLTGPEAVRPASGVRPELHGWRRWGVLGLAAAALVVVWLLPEPVRWKAHLKGPVHFAGVSYGPGDAGQLGAELEQAGLIEAAEDEVLLVLGGTLELLVRPHTQVELPPLPQLDGLTPVDLGLQHGELYVRTRDAYPGNPILVSTPEGSVEVLGTTLGVMADLEGTCVCVADGEVTVTSPLLDRGVQRVSTGQTLFLHRDRSRLSETLAFEELPDRGGAHVGDLVAFLAR